MNNNHNCLINNPHHISIHRPHMRIIDRAAQFAPFAALTGLDAQMLETARHTDRKIELDEDMKEKLDRSFILLTERISEQPEIRITYFMPDLRKQGGKYITVDKQLKKIDNIYRKMIMTDGTEISADDVLLIENTDNG